MSNLSRCRPFARLLCGICLAIALIPSPARAAEDDQARLARELQPLLSCLSGQQKAFTLTAEIDAKIDGSSQRVDARLVRISDDSFDLDLIHQDYAVQIRRRADATAMILPLHKKVFVGRGETDANDHLTTSGLTKRLISPASNFATFAPVLQSGDPNTVALILMGLLKVQYDPGASSWKVTD
ncbi:MAG: hypothetical protein ABI614_28905, partial [Planctomycetota bacterium]